LTLTPVKNARVAALLIAFALSVSGQSASASADTAAADYELLQNKDGGVTITAYRGSALDVIIPPEIGGLKVTVIGPRAFAGKNLTSASIPENVTTIAYCAFANNSLGSIVIPQGVVAIEYEAFSDNLLASVELPESVRSIGVRAFANNKLGSAGIPGRVTFIGKDAFAGANLTGITIGADRNIFTGQGFELSFVNYYASTGRKAGTYSKRERVWTLSE
jgi:hypothetical protein